MTRCARQIVAADRRLLELYRDLPDKTALEAALAAAGLDELGAS